MKRMSVKIYLQLTPPTEENFRSSARRITDALQEHYGSVAVPVHTLRKLYPVCQKADCCLLEETLARYRRRSGSISNHSYVRLIKWHYRLFREAEGRKPLGAAALTMGNLFFGVIKKIKYVKG